MAVMQAVHLHSRCVGQRTAYAFRSGFTRRVLTPNRSIPAQPRPDRRGRSPSDVAAGRASDEGLPPEVGAPGYLVQRVTGATIPVNGVDERRDGLSVGEDGYNQSLRSASRVSRPVTPSADLSPRRAFFGVDFLSSLSQISSRSRTEWKGELSLPIHATSKGRGGWPTRATGCAMIASLRQSAERLRLSDRTAQQVCDPSAPYSPCAN
jgi:hypothetical protein